MKKIILFAVLLSLSYGAVYKVYAGGTYSWASNGYMHDPDGNYVLDRDDGIWKPASTHYPKWQQQQRESELAARQLRQAREAQHAREEELVRQLNQARESLAALQAENKALIYSQPPVGQVVAPEATAPRLSKLMMSRKFNESLSNLKLLQGK